MQPFFQGTVVKTSARGFGFIAPDTGGEELFFHRSRLFALEFDDQLIERRVLYDVVLSERNGKPMAVNVRPVECFSRNTYQRPPKRAEAAEADDVNPYVRQV